MLVPFQMFKKTVILVEGGFPCAMSTALRLVWKLGDNDKNVKYQKLEL